MKIPSFFQAVAILFLSSLCCQGLSAVGFAGSCDGYGKYLTFSQAISYALKSNPDLKALKARYKALENVPYQKASLPDPIVSFNALNLPVDTFDLDQEAMTQMQIKVVQKLPFPGKLSLKKEASQKDVEAMSLRIEEFTLKLLRDVEETWWDLFYIKKALGIIERNKKNIQQMVEVARSKYEVGKGLQQDVLLAQVELTSLFNQEAGLKGTYETAKARLFRLIGKKDASDLEPLLCKAPSLSPLPVKGELLAKAFKSRPLIKENKKEVEAAEKRLALARKEYMPDFTLGAAYGFRQDSPQGAKRPDFASFTFSMNIPIWAGTKQSRKVAQRALEVSEKRQLLRSSQEEVRRQVESSLARYEAAFRQAKLYEKAVIPQARHTLSSMMSGYQVNRVDFLNVIRARLALLRYEKQYWKEVAEAMKARARMRAAIGEVIKEAVNEGN